jgi:phospholipase/carboxylesterase
MTSGIHHFTGITANVQANVDFYVGFLGLRLVKQTGGFADAEQLHLIYGDGLGSPGSLLTFLVWEAAGRGRTGIGQVSEVGLAVSPSSLGDWLTRALAAGIPLEGPSRELDEPVLRLKDPDGLIVKLVGVEMATPAPLGGSPTRVRGVTLLTDRALETAGFVARFGYRESERADMTQRMISDTDIVDIREVSGFVPSGGWGRSPRSRGFPRAGRRRRSIYAAFAGWVRTNGGSRPKVFPVALRPRSGRHPDGIRDRWAGYDRRRSARRAWPNPFPPAA